MNRLILVFLIITALVNIGLAEDQYVNYQVMDNDGFKMYYIAAGTETAASYDVTIDSISLHVSGGFNPGNKTFKKNAADIATFKLFQTSMTALAKTASTTEPTAGTALQGTWVVLFPQDVSPYYNMTALDQVIISSNCLGIDNIKQLAIATSSMTMISFVPPGRVGRNTKIKYAIATATGTCPTIQVFDKDNNALTDSAIMVSGVQYLWGATYTHPIAIGPQEQAISVRVTAQSAITYGKLQVGYTIE